MYSPKIRDDLIPRIYRVAKSAKVPMTRWVNQILERALVAQEASSDNIIARQQAVHREMLPRNAGIRRE